MPLRAQPAAGDAAGQRLARRVRLVADRGERVGQRLLPHAAGEREDILTEDGEQHRPRGRRTDGSATELIAHRRGIVQAAYHRQEDVAS